ncbi:MAG: hypothetical protein U0075_19670 [Thermomicrobiales bacterium]
MDADHLEALVARLNPRLSRRHSLGLIGVFGIASAGLGMEAHAKKNKRKHPRRCFMVGYAFCVDGETVIVNSCGRKRLLKRGETPGRCPDTCVPQCADCAAGDDGCGGTCGCPTGQVCVEATCQPVP